MGKVPGTVCVKSPPIGEMTRYINSSDKGELSDNQILMCIGRKMTSNIYG